MLRLLGWLASAREQQGVVEAAQGANNVEPSVTASRRCGRGICNADTLAHPRADAKLCRTVVFWVQYGPATGTTSECTPLSLVSSQTCRRMFARLCWNQSTLAQLFTTGLTASAACRTPKLFPSAAQPDIVRAAQKVGRAAGPACRTVLLQALGDGRTQCSEAR